MSYKKHIASFAGMSPFCSFFEKRIKMPRILFYHGVIEKPYHNRIVQANQIQFKDFIKQIKYLKKHYHFISTDEFYERFTAKDIFKGNEIILTFDDGYKNNLSVAAPFLIETGIPFTIFISTNIVDKEGFVPTYMVRSALMSPFLTELDIPFIQKKFILKSERLRLNAMDDLINRIKTEDDKLVNDIIDCIEDQFGREKREETNCLFESERIMSWNDARILKEMGVIIGSHTEDHSILHKKQKKEDIEHQIKRSYNKIEGHLGNCKYFAFPNGDRKSVCEDSIKVAKDTYLMSFAVTGKAVSYFNSPAFISRIGASFDLNILKTQLSLLA